MPKQHNSKEMKKLFRKLEDMGFVISDKKKSGTVKIVPPETVSGPVYFTHGTESAYHQIRRDFVRLYGMDVTAAQQVKNNQMKSAESHKV